MKRVFPPLRRHFRAAPNYGPDDHPAVAHGHFVGNDGTDAAATAYNDHDW